MEWYTTRFRFWLWFSMALLNFYSVTIGLKYSALNLVGYSGFFLVFTSIGAVYFWRKLRKEQDEADLS